MGEITQGMQVQMQASKEASKQAKATKQQVAESK